MAQRLLVLLVLLTSVPALAANTGVPDTDLMLGPLKTYTTEQAALEACGAGNVVWAERHAGYHYKLGEARYGTAEPGAYACRADADAANYWDSDPMSAVMGYHGKSFRWPDAAGS